MALPMLSLRAARALHLSAQGMIKANRSQVTVNDVVDAIRRMGLLQIDTIHVVARSPYFVLFSRLGNYPTGLLEQALAQGDLFEYWAHEACFIPIEDYALLRHRMQRLDNLGWKYSSEWQEKHQHDIDQLLLHIRQNGPVRSADFTRTKGKGSGWWDWKPEKRHLETLFTAGHLMVRERRNFQRVYDLTERVLPDWQDERALSLADAEREMLRRSCQYLGLVKAEWMADYYRLKRVQAKPLLAQLTDSGELIAVSVEGLRGDFYVSASQADNLALALDDRLSATKTALLSPFDPIVWHRKRASELFGFDYRIECYTPEAKRQFGYFVLPILQRGELVGRLDAKMHRSQAVFEVKGLWFEKGVRTGKQRLEDIWQAINSCAHWHGAKRVTLVNVPDVLKSEWQTGWWVKPSAVRGEQIQFIAATDS